MRNISTPIGKHTAVTGTDWSHSLGLQIHSLRHMAANLSHTEVENTISTMRSCRGLIVFTGVGQNALLASKAASTYNSLAIRAVAMDAVALLHGNLGLLRHEDLLVVLSKSGNTTELVALVQACRVIGDTRVLTVHATPGCALELLSDQCMYVPLPNETDHLNLVPTASLTCFLSLLQAMAVQLSAETGITAADFARTHPGGTLSGRRVAGGL